MRRNEGTFFVFPVPIQGDLQSAQTLYFVIGCARSRNSESVITGLVLVLPRRQSINKYVITFGFCIAVETGDIGNKRFTSTA